MFPESKILNSAIESKFGAADAAPSFLSIGGQMALVYKFGGHTLIVDAKAAQAIVAGRDIKATVAA